MEISRHFGGRRSGRSKPGFNWKRVKVKQTHGAGVQHNSPSNKDTSLNINKFNKKHRKKTKDD